MEVDDIGLEDVAQDDSVRLPVMTVLYSFGLGEEVIVELLGDLGVDPVMVQEDLEQIKDSVTPGDKPFPTCLKALATISMTGNYGKLSDKERLLLVDILEGVTSVNEFIVLSRGAVLYALSKLDIQDEFMIDIDDKVFTAVFRLVLEPSLDPKRIPQDHDELEFVLIQQIDTLVDAVLKEQGLKSKLSDRPADGPLSQRLQRPAEDDA